jgi:hypothetical protein
VLERQPLADIIVATPQKAVAEGRGEEPLLTTQVCFSRGPYLPEGRAALVILAAVLAGCWANSAESIGVYSGSLVTANNAITQAADETRAGWFPDQPALDPAIVGGGNFKRMWKTQLQLGLSQQVMAQPLVVGGLVLVVTEANNVYLVDALTGVVVTSRNLGPPFDATALGCGDISPTVGITGTPVVDATTNTAYLYSKSSTGDLTLHAVSTADLSESPGFPVTITGPAQNDPSATFQSTYQLQRPGLLLMNGVVYAGFGAHCDIGPYRGWIVGVTTAGVIRTMFATAANTPNVTRGNGIWMSGAGLVSDGPGQILFSTGNGYGNPYASPLLGNAPPGDLENVVARVVLQPDGSLKTTDFFAPSDALALSHGDLDFGSGGVVALPPQFGTATIPHLACIAGKAGTFYLLDRDNLGGFQQGPTDGLAALSLGGGSWSRPGVWPGDGGYIYVTVNGGTGSSGYALQVLKYGTDAGGNPTVTAVGKAPDNVGVNSGSPIVTSNGLASGSALVWMTAQTAELRVYDAVPVNGVLNIRFRDGFGAQSKYTTIGIGGGAAYIGTADGYLVGYSAGTPSVSGTALAFGAVVVGQKETLTATITARQNVTVDALSSSNGAFVPGAPSSPLPAALTAGQSLTVPVTFTPSSATSYLATLSVTTSSTPGALTMTGSGLASGPQLAVSPGSLDFGSIPTGTSEPMSLLLGNSGTSPLTILSITTPVQPFSITDAPVNGTMLAPGVPTSVTVAFAPSSTGAFASSLLIHTDGGDATVLLTGLAAGPAYLVIAPMENDFGAVPTGTSRTMSFVLQNNGGIDLTISKSKPPALGAFVAQTSLPEGSSIAAGEAVIETVTFASNAVGFLSDVWEITGNDSTGLHSVTFTANSTSIMSRTGWVATASATAGTDFPANAVDASTSTRWSTGKAQSKGTQSFTVDMQTAQTFNQITMDSHGDYARSYQLFVSSDGVGWGNPVATGSATASPVIVTFAQQTARFIRIVQLPSQGTGSWWSIYDFNVVAGATPPMTALARTGWTASASATAGTAVPANAIDGSTGSRWSTGQPQSNVATQWFTLDMKSPQTFGHLTMVSSNDFARNWQVYASSDGTTWGSVVAMGAATASPVTVSFPSTTARYIQIRQTSAATTKWWSIYDLNVYAP